MKTLCALILFVCACSPNTSSSSQEGRHPDAKVWHDAPPPVQDAFLGASPGLVTCYAGTAFPSQECSLATTYCCWANYSAPAVGSCFANGTSCIHSDEHCDGPEDCATGETCYAHTAADGGGMLHTTVACATTPVDPSDLIMCRPGGAACPTGSCVPAPGGFMPTQYVCG